MPRALDQLWGYGELVEPHNPQRVRCKLCAKEMNEEINGLKYHLVKIIGK
jgi:hypothetical protein